MPSAALTAARAAIDSADAIAEVDFTARIATLEAATTPAAIATAKINLALATGVRSAINLADERVGALT